MKLTDEERFLSKIKKTPSGCWIWQASINNQGYGIFTLKSKPIKAHRYSYKVYNGALEKGKEICHSCDITACVNPAHLWQGTHGENQKDAFRKGRRKRITNPTLTEAQVKEVLEARRATKNRKWGAKELALKFGVGRECVCRIGRGSTWKSL